MKNTKIYLLTIILILSLGYGCKQTRTCPCFPDKYLTWIPYENKQELKFTNLQDTIIFKIEVFEKSEEYEMDSKLDMSCHAEASFITQKEETTNYILNEKIIMIENEDYVRFQYYINQNNLTDEFTFRIINNEMNSVSEFFDKFIINEKEYKNVIYLKNETSNDNIIITDLYIAENYGIIKFIETDSTEWFLINE